MPVPNPDEFAFQGRTAEEYARFFDLDPAKWDSVLDCGAGPSSFAASTRDETDVVAVDPVYAAPASELRERGAASVERVASHFSGLEERFVWQFYDDLDDRVEYLECAHDRFFEDFAASPDRYVAAALPRLPFREDSFDLALTAHLLFMYEDRLDEAFHYRAVAELCRVARSQVRVYPLATLGGQSAEYVDPVVSRLEADGHRVARRPIPFEFQRGADEMLVVDPS